MLKNHSELLGRLEEKGADRSKFWLVECESLDTVIQHYPGLEHEENNRLGKDDSIIYYHESGSIHQHAAFNKNNKESVESALNWMASFLSNKTIDECAQL